MAVHQFEKLSAWACRRRVRSIWPASTSSAWQFVCRQNISNRYTINL